jgi:hypothetical protein
MHGVTTHKTKIRVPTSVKTNTLIDISAFVISLQNPYSSGVLGIRRDGGGRITPTGITRSYEIQGRNLMGVKRQ